MLERIFVVVEIEIDTNFLFSQQETTSKIVLTSLFLRQSCLRRSFIVKSVKSATHREKLHRERHNKSRFDTSNIRSAVMMSVQTPTHDLRLLPISTYQKTPSQRHRVSLETQRRHDSVFTNCVIVVARNETSWRWRNFCGNFCCPSLKIREVCGLIDEMLAVEVLLKGHICDVHKMRFMNYCKEMTILWKIYCFRFLIEK